MALDSGMCLVHGHSSDNWFYLVYVLSCVIPWLAFGSAAWSLSPAVPARRCQVRRCPWECGLTTTHCPCSRTMQGMTGSGKPSLEKSRAGCLSKRSSLQRQRLISSACTLPQSPEGQWQWQLPHNPRRGRSQRPQHPRQSSGQSQRRNALPHLQTHLQRSTRSQCKKGQRWHKCALSWLKHLACGRSNRLC